MKLDTNTQFTYKYIHMLCTNIYNIYVNVNDCENNSWEEMNFWLSLPALIYLMLFLSIYFSSSSWPRILDVFSSSSWSHNCARRDILYYISIYPCIYIYLYTYILLGYFPSGTVVNSRPLVLVTRRVSFTFVASTVEWLLLYIFIYTHVHNCLNDNSHTLSFVHTLSFFIFTLSVVVSFIEWVLLYIVSIILLLSQHHNSNTKLYLITKLYFKWRQKKKIKLNNIFVWMVENNKKFSWNI